LTDDLNVVYMRNVTIKLGKFMINI